MMIIIKYLALFFMVVFGFLAYQIHQHPQLKFNRLEHRLSHPFDTRVRYKIGTIDPRFGLSRQDVEKLTREAVEIWHQGTGKQWFVYDDKAQLTINFLYDERQQRTVEVHKNINQLERIEQQRQQQHASITPEKQRLEQRWKEIQAQQRQYNANVRQYNTLQQQYAEQNLLHQPNIQAQLNEMHQRLRYEEEQLNTTINRFRMDETSLNFKIDHFNQLTDQHNQTVAKIKQRFPPHQFHKGIFNGREINIYQYWTTGDLRLTLAHEFGHALDLDHHNDPQGLMYPMAQDQDADNFKLKSSDVNLLKQR